MKKDIGVTGLLSIGDIVFVSNPIRKEKYSYYKVNKIDGNKAHTNFRVFNRKIYHSKFVYEYGKRSFGIYDNNYLLVSGSNGFKVL